jgi:hypothetical protein
MTNKSKLDNVLTVPDEDAPQDNADAAFDQHVAELKAQNAPAPEFKGVTSDASGFRPRPLEVGKMSGSERVITPEPREEVEFEKPDFSELDDPEIQRLAMIAGRTITQLNIRHEGDVAWGNIVALNVDTKEQIHLLPDAKFPEGRWIPVNLLPEAYLRSLD